MNRESRQTMVLIGIALIVIAAVILVVSLRLPRVYEAPAQNAVTAEAAAVQAESEAAGQLTQAASAPEKTTAKQQKSSVRESAAQAETAYDYPINLNTATIEALMSIDGLGEVRAGAIIEYREHIGKYTSVEQIKDIKGIDDEIYSRVAGYLCV